MKTRTKPLGKELKEVRDQQGLTIKQLAAMINKHPGYLSQIETGKKIPSVRILEEIAGALDINSNQLLRHINLLKMDFSRPSIYEQGKDALDGLSPTEVEDVLNFVDYLKYKREIEAVLRDSPGLSGDYLHAPSVSEL